MVNTALTLSTLTAMAFGFLFLLGIGVWSPSLSFLVVDPRISAAFVVLCGLFAVGPILDAAAIAYRKSGYVFLRSSLYNGLRVPLPLAFVAIFGIFGLLLPFLISSFVAALLVAFLFLPRFLARYRLKPTLRIDVLRPLFRFSIGNHVAGVIGILVPSLLPILVVNLRGLTENAWFYVAWFLGTVLYVIPSSFATSLFAEGSQRDRNLARDASRAFLGSAVLVVPLGVFLWFWGDLILGVFGPSYATGGFGLLRWLILATPFVVINNMYFTLVRIEKRVAPIILAAALTGIVTLGGSVVLLRGVGLPAVGMMWVIGEALVAGGVGLLILRKRLSGAALAPSS